jgi:lipid II:glycine glycyltransferase (peptidoglycan interpeptide bridge formation enzyme)
MHQGKAAAMAQVLTRHEGPFKIMYVPKGPALDHANVGIRRAVLIELKRYAQENGAIFIKIDPDIVVGWGNPFEPGAVIDPLGAQITKEWESAGLHFSAQQIQFRNSIIVDLRPSEEELLAAMKQKTRYNVRLGPNKKGLSIRFGGIDDMELLYRLYRATAERDRFLIRPFSYYRKAWEEFVRAGLAQPIIAEFKGEPIAHVIIFGFGRRAWYFYGATSDDERNRMPAYALQWEAMRWARSQGMQVYDFWGVPDDFADENDPLAGVYRFKDGFGGRVVRRIGAWDYPASKRLYGLYTRALPAVIGTMKAAGRVRDVLRGVSQRDSQAPE